MLSIGQAEEMVRTLATKFNVAKPKVTSSWGRRSYYRYSEQKIVHGYKSTRQMEHTFIHEFAHHLVQIRYTQGKYGRFRPAAHGEEFFVALVDVTKMWYGDPAKYGWSTEYKRIKQKFNSLFGRFA